MNNIVKIAVDAMGGDKSPKKIIDGIIHHSSTDKNIFYQIFGDKEKINKLLEKKLNKNCFEIVHTSELVKGTDSPLEGAKRGKKTSMWLAVESVKLKNADVVIINGNRVKNFEEKILNINEKLEVFYSHYRPMNIEQFKNKKLLAIAGIGNPENFFQLLENNNLIIEKKLIFPDHYNFSKTEVQNIVDEAEKKNYQVIMTEKDYFKIKDFKIDKIEYLKVSLNIELKEKLLYRIRKLYDKNN